MYVRDHIAYELPCVKIRVLVLDDTRLDPDGLVRLHPRVVPRAVILDEVILLNEKLLGSPPRCWWIAVL